jgi:hypothetical protein
MVAQPSSQAMSVEQWRTLESESHDLKHEYYEHYSLTDTVELQSINTRIPVAAIYQRTTVNRAND